MSATTTLPIPTYTVEEIDNNLCTLANILKYSKNMEYASKRDNVIKQVDNWLDRRLEVTDGS